MDRRLEVEQIARAFLESMQLNLTATVSEEDDAVNVDLSGPDAYLLLERKGTVLDALQLLLGKVAESRLGTEKRVVLDCDGYRKGRKEELVAGALRAAESVRESRQPLELPEMNPYERRLIHLALQNEAGITTESQGEGFMKRIVIYPA